MPMGNQVMNGKATTMVQDAKGTVALERSYRMLRMLSDCNRILVRSTDESRLLNDLCRLLLEQGGCTAVWVGIVQDDITGTVRTAAHAGFQENIPAAFGLSERESDAAFEAWVAQVIRTGQMQCCDDPCRAFAGMRRTFASQQGDVLSLLCFPLVSPSATIGAATLIVPEPGPHPDEILGSLQKLACDMAFGIERLRIEGARKRATDAQRSSELRFWRLLEGMPDSVVIQTGGRLTYANPTACTLLGASTPDELLGRPVLDFFKQDKHAYIKERIAQLDTRGDYAPAVEHTLLRLDGAPVTVEMTTAPLRYRDQVRHEDRDGMLVFMRNITARKLQEHLYESLVEDTPAHICRFRPDGELTFASGVVSAFLGLDKGEIVGANAFDFLLPEERMLARNALMNTSAEYPRAEYTVSGRRADGQLRQVRCLSRAIFGPDGSASEFQMVAFDITDQLNLEERLSQTNKLETIGMLAGGIAHDFNNMLQTILGFGELALLETPPPDPRASDVQEVIAAANRAKRLTGQLLAFSRNSPMEITRVQLNRELENDQRMLARLLGENIKIVLELDETLPDILADAGHVEQVLLNLAVNARDAMPDGGTLTLQTTCVTLTDDDDRLHPGAVPGDYVCWSISDTGCGIPPHIQRKIFDPFFTTKPKDRGTGLGLSTVYGIVRQLNGWILVDSEPGQGTTFAVYFPVAKGVPTKQTEEQGTVSRSARRDARILVVEDQEKVAHVVERIFASRGFDTRVVGGVAEALAALEEPGSAYDLVFCDVALEDGNGIELAEKISERNPDMRFLFTSGYVDEKSGWTAIKQRGWKCLVKPCPANELLAAVDEVLARDMAVPHGGSYG